VRAGFAKRISVERQAPARATLSCWLALPACFLGAGEHDCDFSLRTVERRVSKGSENLEPRSFLRFTTTSGWALLFYECALYL